MKSFVYYKLAHLFHQGPLNMHKVVKRRGCGAEYKNKKCKCSSVLRSGPPWTDVPAVMTGSVYLICCVLPQQQAGSRGTQAKAEMWRMILHVLA